MLKKHLVAELEAPATDHSTIIEAVKKEKKKDLPFKLQKLEEGKKYKLKILSNGKNLEFRLYIITCNGINLNNL